MDVVPGAAAVRAADRPTRCRRPRTPGPRCTTARIECRLPSCGRGPRSCSNRPYRTPSAARSRPRTPGRGRLRAQRPPRASPPARTRTPRRAAQTYGHASSRASGTVTRPRSPSVPSSVASVTPMPLRLESIDAEEVGARPRAIEEAAGDACGRQVFAERGEGCETGPAGDHPHLRPGQRRRERTAERSEARQPAARRGVRRSAGCRRRPAC